MVKISLFLTWLKFVKGILTLSKIFPNFSKFKAKFALGVICLIFLLDYQPTFSFPPIKKQVVNAQVEQTQQITAASLPFGFQLPHPGYITTHFSSWHPGIDIATGLGMPIKPIAPGTIVETGYNFWGLGLVVVVDHGSGYRSLYAHMGKIYVTKDQKVGEGDLLGEVGLTGRTSGPHTHLEVYKDNGATNPLALLPEMRQYPIAEDFKPVGNPAAPAVPVGGTANQKTYSKTVPTPTPEVQKEDPQISKSTLLNTVTGTSTKASTELKSPTLSSILTKPSI